MDTPVQDWQHLRHAKVWLREHKDLELATGPLFEPARQFQDSFPFMTELLGKARRTKVKNGGNVYDLFGWTARDGSSLEWLCPEAGLRQNKPFLHNDHRVLLQSFGGIREYWSIYEYHWLLNWYWILCENESCLSFPPGVSGWENGWRDYYRDLCAQEWVEPIVEGSDYVTFGAEANANLLLYHRETSEVLMFIRDGAPTQATPLQQSKSCIDLPFHTVDRCPDLVSWVEALARDWSRLLIV